jgi:AcrR family transcriptional regulator
MDTSDFQRARSPEAKQQREDAILAAARALGAERGIRQITLTDIADAVGMHKSALLRYFETREQIFLLLSAQDWREWSAALRAKLERASRSATAEKVASAFSSTLADRGMFCDLLAQTPLNLERNVSLEAVRAFKLVTHQEVDAIVEIMRRLLPGLTERDCIDVIAAHSGKWPIPLKRWRRCTEVTRACRTRSSRSSRAYAGCSPRCSRERSTREWSGP